MPPHSPVSSDDRPAGSSPATNRPADERGPATLLRSVEDRDVTATHILTDIELHSEEPPSDVASAPLPTVPGYELHGVLGVGGMGVVYRAFDLKLKRPVALKMIASEHASPSTQRRFHMEAQTVARLRHPNVVQIYEVGEIDGRPFLALELIEGGSLGHRLSTSDGLPAPEATRLVATLAHAIHHAHLQGVVHRDLKPSNVLLEQVEVLGGSGAISRGQLIPKIADFGLAKLLDSDQSRTRSGAILGTPVYMAPEQARAKDEEIGPPADIYALGVILFECLTGRLPFEGDNSWEVLNKVVTTDAPAPSSFRLRLSRDLDTICLKCLEKDPARRYASAAALADDLDRFAAGEAISARPEGFFRRMGRRARRRPLAVALILLLVGTLVLMGGFWQLRRSHAQAALDEGLSYARRGEYASAAACLKDEMDRVGRVPGCSDLYAAMFRAWIAAELRGLTERLMFDYDSEHLTIEQQRRLVDDCERLWSVRHLILPYATDKDPGWETQVRSDLRDVVTRGADIEFKLPTHDLNRRDAKFELRAEELRAFAGPSEPLRLDIITSPGSSDPKAQTGQLRDEDTDTALECHQYGRACLRTGDLRGAERLFRKGLRLNPHALSLYFDLGQLGLKTGDLDTALASFTACLAIKPMAVAYSRRGFVCLGFADRVSWWQLQEWSRWLQMAESDIEAALARDPNHAESLFARGQLRFRQGQPALAYENFESALQRDYPRERLLKPLAKSALNAHNLGFARKWLNESTSLWPKDKEVLDMFSILAQREQASNLSPPKNQREVPKS